jgi:hypothetical protein
VPRFLDVTDQSAAQVALGVGVPFDAVVQGGIDNSGSSDVRAAIQSLVDTYAGVRPIRFPRGEYRLGTTTGSNAVVLPDGAHVIADPGAVFLVNARDNVGGRGASFFASGTRTDPVALTVDQPAFTPTVTLPTGAGAQFAVGDIIGIASDATDAYQLNKVVSKSGDVIRLDSATDFAYLVADNAKFFKVTPVSVVLEGLRFKAGPSVNFSLPAADIATYAIRITRGDNCLLRDIYVENMTGSVVFDDVMDSRIDGLNVNRLPKQSGAEGYGLTLIGGCANIQVDGLRGRETRHLFTTIGVPQSVNPIAGGPRDIQINGAIGYGASAGGYAVFDTHSEGRRINFNQCIAVGQGFVSNAQDADSGFNIRAKHVVLNDCTAVNFPFRGVTVAETAQNVVISGRYYRNNTGIALLGSDCVILPDTQIFNNQGYGVVLSNSINSTVSGRIYNNGQSGAASIAGILDDLSLPSLNARIVGAHIPKSSTQQFAAFRLSSSASVVNCDFPGYGTESAAISWGSTAGQVWNVLEDNTAIARPVATTAVGASGAEDGANTWARLMVVTFGALNNGRVTLQLAVASSRSATPSSALINVYVNTSDSAPTGGISMMAHGGVSTMLGPDSFRLVGDTTKAELWVQKKATFGQVVAYELLKAVADPLRYTLTYDQNSAWQSAAPTGATFTHTTDGINLSNGTQLPVAGIASSTTQALGVGSVELGHATDTSISRLSAGVAAVEGVPIVTRANGLTVNVQTFTANGTWTKPAGAVAVTVRCIGGGGGGGAGARGPSGTSLSGGGGGGGGAFSEMTFGAADLGATETVTVGTGGTGAAQQTTDGTAGANGTNGGHTTFGNHLRAARGAQGVGGGLNAAGTGGGGGVGHITGGAGAAGLANGSAPSAASLAAPSAGGGGAGGGINTGGTASAGSDGGQSTTTNGVNLGPGGSGAAGQNGGSSTSFYVGAGGGGGGANASGAGYAGGNGGNYGAGGGGGGAALNGAASGAGGNGGSGLVMVTTYF